MSGPTCDDLRERLDLLALGALDALEEPPDEAALRAHLEGCAACATRARGLEGTAARLAAPPAPLAPDLRERVLARVGGPTPPGPRRRGPGWLAAGALGIALIALAGHGQPPRPAPAPPGPASEVRPSTEETSTEPPVAPLEPLGPPVGPVDPDVGPGLVGPVPDPPAPPPADVAPVESIGPAEAAAAHDDPRPVHIPDTMLPVGK